MEHEVTISYEDYIRVDRKTLTFLIVSKNGQYQKGEKIKISAPQWNNLPKLYFNIGDVYCVSSDCIVLSLLNRKKD